MLVGVHGEGYRNAYLGDVAEPVVYGVQGALRTYYGESATVGVETQCAS